MRAKLILTALSFMMLLTLQTTGYASLATDAAAAAAVQSLANTASMVILKNQGMTGNIVSTPNGAVVVPSTDSSQQSAPPVYQQQNDQGQKSNFYSGK